MLCFGLHQGYGQFGLSAFTMHDQWLPPPAPRKFIPGLIEGPAFMGWHPGRFLTHKVGTKTYFDSAFAVQQGHDAGYLIPHVAIPPNTMMGVNMLFSKHKVMFPVTSVLIEGKPMGTYFFLILGGLICSSPVSLPTGVLFYCRGTVLSSLSLKDILLGIAFIVVDVIIDAVWSLIVKGEKWKNFSPGRAFPAIYKRGLEAIWNKTMTGPMASLITRQVVSKLADHLTKSWIVSPLVSGTISQTAQPVTGVPRTSLPTISVGRGNNVKYTFFPGGSAGNTSN